MTSSNCVARNHLIQTLGALLAVCVPIRTAAATTADCRFQAHSSYVITLKFGPESTRLLSSGADGFIKVWDVMKTQKSVVALDWREYDAGDVARSNLLTYRIKENQIVLRDPSTDKSLELKGHTAAISAVRFSPDRKVLASAGEDKTVRLWDTASGKCIGKLEGHKAAVCCLAFQRGGNLLASGGSDDDPRVLLWDVQRQQFQKALIGHRTRVAAVAFSPDGHTLVSTGGYEAVGEMHLWDLEHDRHKKFDEADTSIEATDISPDGKLLATGSLDGTISLWDIGKLKHALDAKATVAERRRTHSKRSRSRR